MQYRLKIVPDDQPNADGRWVSADVPPSTKPYDFEPKPGFHVVQAVRDDPQDGGPMHAHFLSRGRYDGN